MSLFDLFFSIDSELCSKYPNFVLKHQRKVDFWSLCETVHLHLSNIAKYPHQPRVINLQGHDTPRRYLDALSSPLNTSIQCPQAQAEKARLPVMMARYYKHSSDRQGFEEQDGMPYVILLAAKRRPLGLLAPGSIKGSGGVYSFHWYWTLC